MSIFSKIGAWFAKIFKSIKDHAAPVAVAVTEGVKAFLNSGAATGLASVVDGIIGSNVAEDVVTLLKKNINKALAVELAVQGLPDNPSADDILNFENAIIKAFSRLDASGKSKLYTVLAAQVYGIIENTLNENPKPTFAEWVAAVEEAYNDFVKDKAAIDDGAEGSDTTDYADEQPVAQEDGIPTNGISTIPQAVSTTALD